VAKDFSPEKFLAATCRRLSRHRKVKKEKLSKKAKPASAIKGDLDNYCKFVLDCLQGSAYVDDRQVVYIEATKRWTNYQEAAKTQITITRVPA